MTQKLKFAMFTMGSGEYSKCEARVGFLFRLEEVFILSLKSFSQ